MFFKAVVNIVRFLVSERQDRNPKQGVHSKGYSLHPCSTPQKSAGSSFYFFWCLPAYLFLNGEARAFQGEIYHLGTHSYERVPCQS